MTKSRLLLRRWAVVVTGVVIWVMIFLCRNLAWQTNHRLSNMSSTVSVQSKDKTTAADHVLGQLSKQSQNNQQLQWPFCPYTEVTVLSSSYGAASAVPENVTIGTSCNGDPKYHTFASALWSQVLTQSNINSNGSSVFFSDNHPSQSRSRTHRDILFVGSKFMARVAVTWLCQLLQQQQQQQALASAAIITPPVMETSMDKMVTRYALSMQPHYNMTLWVVTDSYFIYSPRWLSLLETQLSQAANRSIRLTDDFDGVVLGPPSLCTVNDTSKYTDRMQRFATLYANASVDCFANTPPTLRDWGMILPHHVPLVYVTLPHLERVAEAQAEVANLLQPLDNHPTRLAAEQLHEPPNFSHVRVVSSRRYLDRLLATSPDCRSTTKISTCQRGAGSPRRPCTGQWGGLVDTVVWDTVQALESVWQQTTSKSDAPLTASLPQYQCAAESTSSSTVNTTLSTPQFCHSTHITAAPDDVLATPVGLTYWCEGPHYDRFVRTLQRYVRKQQRPRPWSRPSGNEWGRRLLPANRRILILGNSHTRQMAYSLLCQQHQQVELQSMHELHFHGPLRYSFCPLNTTVVTVFNSHFPYSRHWLDLLQDEIQEPLTNFDAVVLGLFNHCGGPNSFSRDMEALTQSLPDADCLHIHPPSLQQWATAFDGALIFVSMFSTNQLSESEAARQEVHDLQHKDGRTNVAFVDARRHITALRNECASYSRVGVSDCVEKVVNETFYDATHRCVGAQGGHPDLVAFDVMEHLHTLLT